MSKRNLEAMREVLRKRQTEYQLAPEWVASKEEVVELLSELLMEMPTHFNAQTVRMVLVSGDTHTAHWDLIEQILIDQIGEEHYNESTRDKIHGSFRSGVGTVLFFDDTSITKKLQEDMPAYATNFARWAREVQGSHQFAVWMGLTALGFGASLQHYNGMADDKVREQLGLPEDWDFIGHMPFGKVVEPAEKKDKIPVSERLIIK